MTKAHQLPALLLGLQACAPSLPDPEVGSVSPNWAYNGEEEQIRIFGEHFYPHVEVDVREEGARYDRQFQVELELGQDRYPLSGVEMVSYGELLAWVPVGIPPDVYTLAVTSPLGAEARLPGSFSVTDTRAESLRVSTEDNTYLVEEPFALSLALLDQGGDVMLQAFDVVLSITALPSGADDAPKLGYEELLVDTSNFDNATVQVTDEGYHIALTLRAGETSANSLTLTGRVPRTLAMALEPADSQEDIQGGWSDVTIDPLSLDHVQVLLPEPDFVTTAGEPFELELRLTDELGNLIEDARATVVLQETCGTASVALDVVGADTVSFAALGATNEDCPENTILASGTVSGGSEGFQVEPDDAVGYDVSVFPRTVTAGELALVTVRAIDAYGNQVVTYGEDWLEQHGSPLAISLEDEQDGLDPSVDYGGQICPGFEEGYQICQAWLDRAGAGNHITATGEDGLEGKSNGFEVEAAALSSFELGHGLSPFAAGVAFTLQVRPVDHLGNSVGVDPISFPYQFVGSPQEIDCVNPTPTSTAGEWAFDCTVTVVTAAETVTVSAPSYDPSVSRTLEESFEIENGPLGLAVFSDPDGGDLVAGEDFTISLQVFDAYGNPYIVQSTNTVGLTDCSGSLSITTMTFDSDGSGQALAAITSSADSCAITAWDGALELGDSASFTVRAGEAATLLLTLAQPWAFLDEPLPVEIEAVDAWGNRVTDFEEQILLSSQGGNAEPRYVSGFDEGLAEAELSFDIRQLGDGVEALSTGGIHGEAGPLDVLEDDGSIVADLLVDGTDEPVMCLASGLASATLDASGSTGGIVGYHFDDGAGGFTSTASPSTTASWTEQRAYRVRSVAYDADARGSEVELIAYVAEADGEPAGPVYLSPDYSERVVGSSVDGVATISVEAFDCAGDVAANGTLWLRTDLGEIVHSSVTPTGEGLTLLLDGGGTASFLWSVASTLEGGAATVLAGRAGAAALGSTSIEALGDNAGPVLLGLDPVGASAEISDTFTARFDEPMLAASLSGAVVFEDSAGPLEVAQLELDSTGHQLTAVLDTPVDLAADVYGLTLSSQLRDAAGNRLDGAWDGGSSSLLLLLGAVVDSAPDMVSCVPDTTTFRPDGADVVATVEADSVQIVASADGSASQWLVEVFDADAEERLVRWIPSSGTSVVIDWDGRDQDGLILPNGEYQLLISGADAYLNPGTPCALDLVIDNIVAEVP